MFGMLEMDVQSIQEQIDRLFGGKVASVLNRWPTEFPPNRSTISRWLQRKSLPHSAEQLLSLAGALDLDPFALWQIKPATFPLLCMRVLKAYRQDKWESLLDASSFIKPFFSPASDWPPTPMARRYFRRKWYATQFRHTALEQRNYYSGLSIQPVGKQFNQVWHFAWRDPIRQAVWRPYGFVRRFRSKVTLYGYGGLVDHTELEPGESLVHVETWFGEGAAEFSVISLHSFELKVLRAIPSGAMKVRFDVARWGPAM